MIYLALELSSNDLSIVSNAAAIYAKELLGYSLVVLYKDTSTSLNSYTVHFNERNFMHLTGICHKSIENYNTGRFFHLALERRLVSDDFEMVNSHTTPRKLEVIETTLKNLTRAYMIGTYNNSGPLLVTDRIVGNLYSCVGFAADEYNGCNYPNTLLKGDTRQKLRDCHQICAIFRKKKREESYSEATYIAKKIPWDTFNFPEEFQYLKDIIIQHEIQHSKSSQHP